MLALGPRSSGIGLLLAGSVLCAASCGGSTKDDTRSIAGAGGQAGSAAGTGGGSSGSAGTSGGMAGSVGMSGSGGAGGLPERCKLPEAPGNCNAYFPAYFHNVGTGVCEPFVYGGCGGNENRFETLEECQAACRGGTPDMDACTATSECMVTSVGCCPNCQPENERGLVAINRMNLSDYQVVKGCSGVDCAACPEVDELQMTSQNFVAKCEAGACKLVDIRKTPITECVHDQNCMLRDGANCCEGCDGRGLVSVRPDMNLELCDAPSSCPPCVPQIPPEYYPFCSEGRCTVGRVTR